MSEHFMDRDLLLHMQGYNFFFSTTIPDSVIAYVALAIEEKLMIQIFCGPTFHTGDVIEQKYFAKMDEDYDQSLDEHLKYITVARQSLHNSWSSERRELS